MWIWSREMFRAMGTVETVMSGNRQPVSLETSSQLKESTRKFSMKYASIEVKERTRAKLCVCCGGWDIGNGYLMKSQLSCNSCLDCSTVDKASEIHASSWTDERQDVSYLKWRRCVSFKTDVFCFFCSKIIYIYRK